MKVATLSPILPIAIALLLCSGCAALHPQSDASTATREELFESLEALKGTGPTTGISSQAREIEKSLGGF